MSLKMTDFTEDCKYDFSYNGATLTTNINTNNSRVCCESADTCREAPKSNSGRFDNILYIYENKKIKEEQDKADMAINVLIDEDKYAKILKETIKKIRDEREAEEENKNVPDFCYRYYVSSETNKKIMNVILKKDEAIEKLKNKIDEVKALLELTDTFQEAQSILKQYDII